MKNVLKIFLSVCVAFTFCNCEKHWNCPGTDLQTDFNSWLPDYKKGDSLLYKDSIGNKSFFQVYSQDLTAPSSGTYDFMGKKSDCPLNASMSISGDQLYMVYTAYEFEGVTEDVSYVLMGKKFLHPLYHRYEDTQVADYIHYDSLTLLQEKFADVYKLTQPTDTSRVGSTIYIGRKKGVIAYSYKGDLFVLKN